MRSSYSYILGSITVVSLIFLFSCSKGIFGNAEKNIIGTWTSLPVDSAEVERWFFNEEGRLFVSRGEDTALFYFEPLDTVVNYLEYLIDNQTINSYITISTLGQSLNMNVGPIARKFEIVTLSNSDLYLSSEDVVDGETIVGDYQRSFTK